MNRNNRKNNGKLFAAKSKLVRCQATRKLLFNLHNLDDGSLDEKIEVAATEVEDQSRDIDELSIKVDKIKPLVDDALASVKADKIEIDALAHKVQ